MLLRSALVAGLVACLTVRPSVGIEAQQSYTTQVMVVSAFGAPDRGIGGKAADVIRGRIGSAFEQNVLKVISGGDIDDWLRRSGFEENVELHEGELHELSTHFRADERITGTVARTANSFHITATLALVRDLRLSQPLTGDGASVDEAADLVAREAIAARAQLVPLRQCENAARAGDPKRAAAAATTGIRAYPRAVPARVCLLNAIATLGVSADSVIAVARAVIAVAPTNAVALGDLAEAYDAKGERAAASPVWVRLLDTDSTNEDLIERVVNALSRDHETALAQPLIDRGTDAHPENLPLLKLRWLVHLANTDWKGAIDAGDKLMQHDAASQIDPDLYVRLSAAYRADSQPERALSIAAAGVSRFPKSAPLFVAYLRLLESEHDAALARGLAQFSDNAEVHVIAAQSFKATGRTADALTETHRALAANPRLPHGFLQLAQLQFDLGQPDSAAVSIQQAPKFGEDSNTTAQFALARGNALYKAATGTQKREDYQRAMTFLSLAAAMKPTPEAKFLLGASALSISQSAASEAPASKSCELSKLADESLTEAQVNLTSGGSVAPEAAKTYLEYVEKLRPFVADQLKAFCS
ncbi:MAG TPA: hypothetical protein VHV78_12955 [Gemmatimonadaceae bacterium]|jgi:tetratricopeptide (TPR) repeat protein|nr:hypothetical protein [Gemmatimonadaceae bacterium]